MLSAILISFIFLCLSCLSLVSAHPVKQGTIQYSHDRHNHYHRHRHHRPSQSHSSHAHQLLPPENPLLERGVQNLAPGHQVTIAMKEAIPHGVSEASDSNNRVAL